LRAERLITTGTPSDVRLFMEPKGFWKEVEMDGIGSIKIEMVF
jgi:hypothetical protein